MNDKAITATVSVLLAVIGLAIVAILVSGRSQTGGVLGAFGSAIGQLICTATAPVTGKTCGSLTSSVSSIFTPITGGTTSPPTYGQPGYPGCPFGMTC